MARPRVFISSTFYDLRHVRADLERGIRDLGYEPVLHERGNIPYGSQEKLEEYCYREIGNIDILVAIVGGRFGSGSEHQPYSISQMEIKTALELGKQVYLFVDRSVWSEFSTFQNNRDVEGINYRFVDDTRVYEFLDEVTQLPQNNPTTPFETSEEIIAYLKEQWAGLFQRFLQQQSDRSEVQIVQDMKATARTLDQLVTFLTEERRSHDQTVRDILLSNHPAFEALKKATDTSYRVFFTNEEEYRSWLKARGFSQLAEFEWDDPNREEWSGKRGRDEVMLTVSREIFDEDGNLKVLTAEEWEDDYVKTQVVQREPDDDLPF